MAGRQGTSSKKKAIVKQLEVLQQKSAELNTIEAELVKATNKLNALKRQATQAQALYEQAKQDQARYANKIKLIKTEVAETGKIVADLKAQFTKLKEESKPGAF